MRPQGGSCARQFLGTGGGYGTSQWLDAPGPSRHAASLGAASLREGQQRTHGAPRTLIFQWVYFYLVVDHFVLPWDTLCYARNTLYCSGDLSRGLNTVYCGADDWCCRGHTLYAVLPLFCIAAGTLRIVVGHLVLC